MSAIGTREPPDTVPYARLAVETPDWVIECAQRRNQSYMRKHTDAPRTALIWQWAVDYSGLPSTHRRLLDVMARIQHGEWGLPSIAERVGAHERTVRRATADLESWGWLEVVRLGRPHKNQYAVTVPVDKPPDRVSIAGRRRP